jgi:hypothetical protein
VVLNFWVSAKKPGEGQSKYLAQLIAERLKALLTNRDIRYELAERGITHLQPQGSPQPMPSADYAKRLASCNAQLNYYLQYEPDIAVSQPRPDSALGDTQTVNFSLGSPTQTGTYLLGYYRWSVPVRVTSGVSWPGRRSTSTWSLVWK